MESLFPGRIDMGLGRSVGFTEGVRRALGRDKQDADDFAEQLRQLLGWFTGEQTDHPQVHAHPAEGLRPAPFVLAMGSGATIAAEQGLPLVIGDLSDPDRMQRGIDTYRDGFRPSRWAEHPYVVISGTVAVAATTDQARSLLIPEAGSAAYSRTRGSFRLWRRRPRSKRGRWPARNGRTTKTRCAATSTARRRRWSRNWRRSWR
ncbi:LLM class flavin-dependent oxidoreductase [Melissospora conviva]|uniref:LLM class flavin-dependent oxidoreductase n=1 Tax=Melissospora conviva TaxID=3388432 RepID=UPI003B7714C1